MPDLDFTTALGRLLRDGSLRDEFSRDPEGVISLLGVTSEDRSALIALDPENLEMQARVLLRKRFEAMRRILPGTCAQVSAWERFQHVSRHVWPQSANPALEDAGMFLNVLQREASANIRRSERNRVRFATGPGFIRIHAVTDLWIGNKRRAGIQIFIRSGARGWREQLLFFAL